MSNESGKLSMVPISQIRENPAALRSVDPESEGFCALVDSIAKNGILNPPLGVEAKDPETGEMFIRLVDGLQRFTAAKAAGLKEIPMHIKDMDEAGVLEAQIITNIQRIETKPAEYAKGLLRLMALNPTLVMAELAERLSVSITWLQQRLKLVNLIDSIAELVDNGQIILTNAINIAKLPPSEQPNWVESAMTESPAEFVPKILARAKEITKAGKEGRDARAVSFEDTIKPVVRKRSEVMDELENQKIGRKLCNEMSISTPEDGFALGVKWMMQIDPTTVEVKKAEWEQKQAEKAEKAEKRKAEREANKAELAAQTEAAIKAE
jgi:ParB family chromosome partitioning protein